MKILLGIFICIVSISHYCDAGNGRDEVEAKLPDEWVMLKGNALVRYAKYIESLGLKKVEVNEVLAPHFKQHKGVPNDLPPQKMWKDIAKVLQVVDKLASDLDANDRRFIKVYMSPAYNKARGGSVRSFYTKNMAVRIAFDGIPVSVIGRAARKLRDDGAFKGGIGIYPDSVHIDTRGDNVDW